MGTISIKGMRFYAFHGVHPAEQKVGQWYTVHLTVEADTALAEKYDQLDSTVDYSAVYHCCKKLMSTPVKLIEHLNANIGKTLLNEFKQIQRLQVEVIKHHPPFDGCLESAAFTQVYRRDEL